ncbi:MAG: hypothetical protein FJW35_18970, partial [Acidobacteria bacterium]|nr:hypothetical protein [Acidobacteriota bacterium]
MKKTSLMVAFAILLLVAAVGGFSQEKPTLLQDPTLSRTQIAFAYAGDLWVVPRAGGEAVRLTIDVGQERQPLFSPDGS